MGARGPQSVPQGDPGYLYNGIAKRCTRCGETKVRSEGNFGLHQQAKNGIVRFFINPSCRPCESRRSSELAMKRRAKGWLAPPRPQEEYRRANLRRYRMTPEDYDALLESQGGTCAICKHPDSRSHENGVVRSMCVDHDHATGKVRGLLCNHCNSALGYFHDSQEHLATAIKYLEKAHG